MDIATVLFTYNRDVHTKKVIEALKKNTAQPQKLIIFQDGLIGEQDRKGWIKVKETINNIDWCDTEVIMSEKNKGVAYSMITGLNQIFQKFDAAIVLEDDDVPQPEFMKFMYECLEKYKSDKRVYQISGYMWPLEVEEEYDIIGCGRECSWGWGTWKDRWSKYRRDYDCLYRMQRDCKMSKKLALWGADFEDMLASNVKGMCDSWSVFWAMTMLENDGIGIQPCRSLIENIGHDGSGAHCSASDKYRVSVNKEKMNEFRFPDKVEISVSLAKQFYKLTGGYTAVAEENPDHEYVLVYGVGGYFKKNEEEINRKYNIIAFIDRHKKYRWYAGKEIIKPDEVGQYQYSKIVVVISDTDERKRIKDNLVSDQYIPQDKIIFWA